MKKRILWIVIVLVSLLWLSFGYNRFRSSFSTEDYMDKVKPIALDSSKIYLYGDSWVGNQSLDSYFIQALIDNNLKYRVKSLGYPGANSKELYETLLGKGYLKSAFEILDSAPKYCVVIVGVNDAASQMGPDFYAFHTTKIIQTLLHHGITPVLLELPEFGIDKIMKDCGVIIKSKNTLMAIYNNKGETDNILTYRSRLQKKLVTQHLLDQIIFVPYEKISTDYSKNRDLYRDAAHLNKVGKIKLCKEIVRVLANK